jgi:hypothetical protein
VVPVTGVGLIRSEGLTYEQLVGRVDSLAPAPDGFRRLTALTDAGYGAFSFATPDNWPFWLWRQDSNSFVDLLTQQDPVWGTNLLAQLEESNRVEQEKAAVYRALVVDSDNDALSVVTLAVSDGSNLDSGNLAARIDRSFTSASATVDQIEEVTLDESRAVMVVAIFDNATGGWLEPVVEQKLFILDERNDRLWSLTCNLHASIAVSYHDTCEDILSSLSVFGPVVQDQ